MRALVVALAVLPLVSCGCAIEKAEGTCAWMRDGDSDAAKTGGTVVLVDASASVRGGPGSAEARDDASVVAGLVQEIVTAQDAVSVGWFGGGPEVTWTAREQVVDWGAEKNHPKSQAALRRQAVTCLTHDIADAESARPDEGGTDVLAAMRTAGQVLTGAGSERKLIVLTDGLATRGCADLRAASFRDPAEAESITWVCRNSRLEVRDRMLAGVHTRFVGLGRTGGAQPAPDEPQRAWLENLWLGLCAAAGPGTCEVVPTTVQTRPGDAAPRPDDPVIRYGSGQRVITLPGAALFEPLSPVLRADALPKVTEAAVDIRSRGATEVHVYGYVDPRGDPANNIPLSLARAEAVAEALRARGVADVTPHGRGLDTSACPLATTGTETLGADWELQCDRRVDIVVTE